MGDVLQDVVTYGIGTIIVTALLCGLCPRLVLRLLLLAYPSEDPRRPELLAELSRVPYRERLIWVADQIPTALMDGVPERVRARRVRRVAKPEGPDLAMEASLDSVSQPLSPIVYIQTHGTLTEDGKFVMPEGMIRVASKDGGSTWIFPPPAFSPEWWALRPPHE
ncbi:hypothetical protein ACFVYA_37015 [Amycolatopsis sp. NPDC058278]|uniref:hypothetical protein n=1 Tax=Amycolatopsis sp. NPDC058278 TaxID=3346417 RepID=UPI0036DDDDD4